MKRIAAILFFATVSLVGCFTLRSADAVPSTPANSAEAVTIHGSGHLAYIGADGNIYPTFRTLKTSFLNYSSHLKGKTMCFSIGFSHLTANSLDSKETD
jgi:hypothetical protein